MSFSFPGFTKQFFLLLICLCLFALPVGNTLAAGPGDSCSATADCDEGDCGSGGSGCFCSGLALGPTGTCERRRAEGASCSDDEQCQVGLTCNIAPGVLRCEAEEAPEDTPTGDEETADGEDTEGEAPRSRTPESYGYRNPLGTTSVNTVINRVVRAALGIVGAIFLAVFIWGGALWMTAAGDPDKVKKAKSALINSVIGMVVVALSYTILNIFFGFAGSLFG